MRKSKVGPIDLLGGLQLQPADGKPDGLLRALNMENRDNLLQTRRGAAMANYNATTSSAPQPLTFQPANLAGATVFYIGLLTLPPADSIIHLQIGGTPGYVDDVPIDEVVTFEFWGNDDAWHALDVINIGYVLGAKWIDLTAGIELGSLLNMLVPFGWKNAQPPGTPSIQQWLRVTRTTPWIGGVVLNGIVTVPTAGGLLATVICPTTRAGASSFMISPVSSLAPTWRAIKTGDRPSFSLVYSQEDNYLSHAGIAIPFDGAGAAAVYIPSSDIILASMSGKWVQIDCALAPNIAGAAAFFDPIVDLDGPYGDIPCLNAMPVTSPSFLVMFGGRVFAGGFTDAPSRLIWSAPEEFWATWPAANEAILGAGAAGKMVGAAAVGEALFIVTTSGIWRASLADPTEGNESDLFVDIVEEVPCVAPKSITPVEGGFIFLSHDGVRLFDSSRGQSRVISDGIRDLFRPDSGHALACLNKATAMGVWHRVENQYRMSYTSPGGFHNDTVLVIDLDDLTCHLWGADQVAFTDDAIGPVGQRARAVRVGGWAWDDQRKTVLVMDPEGVICVTDTGYVDVCQKVPWYFESQTLRIGSGERSVLERAELSIAREHFQTINVSVIPDGNYARKDTRAVAVQSDGLNTAAAFGSASLAAPITPLQLRDSFAPLIARFRKAARNHRVLVESIAPGHAQIKALAMTVDMAVDESRR